jgi:AmiR/NasT family two-component response regulator
VLDIQAAGFNATRQELAAARREVEGLRAALETRHTIGLAQGILMARHTLSVAQAFDYLRRRSQSDNVKLRQIAVDLVAEVDATRRGPVDGHAREPRGS